MRAVWVLIAVGLGVAALPADVIYVSTDAGDDAWTGLCETYDGDLCGPKKTIAAAMSAAVDGDEVVLAMGVYKGDGNRDLDFAGKAITVRSSQPDDADVVAATVIDCEGTAESRHRVFTLVSGEGTDSIIDGLMLTGGYAPLVKVGNRNLPHGGTILILDSGALVRRSVFDRHVALSGAGVYTERSTVEVDQCTFTRCTPDPAFKSYGFRTLGGAIQFDTCDFSVTDSRFERNEGAAGGAIATFYSSGVLLDCQFTGNSTDSDAATRGGAVTLESSTVRVARCRFLNNTATHAQKPNARGGALHVFNGPVEFENCLFINNKADTRGGAAALAYNAVTLKNCVAIGNDAPSGDTFHVNDCAVTLLNSISWSNDKPFDVTGAGTLNVQYCDIQGGWNGDGNIDADPAFVDVSSHNYRLRPDSPCIDTGDPNDIDPGTDLDGLRRVWNGRIDMGAYEFGSFSYGDVNCDGAVNFDDIDPFVAALIGQETYDDELPECDWLNADVDGDGTVSFADIDPFVLLLIGE